jgi:hypothetical protein
VLLAPGGRRGERGGAAGALLLRRCLQGPQDLTIYEQAIEIVARMWHVFAGGHVDLGRSCEWMHVLRPERWGVEIARRRLAGGATASRRRAPARGLLAGPGPAVPLTPGRTLLPPPARS